MINRAQQADFNIKPRREKSRRGFTLMEIMLVLAIMIAMGAVIWPAIDRSMTRDALRYSGDKLRAALASARVEAMRSGVIQAFRYEPETGKYIVEPWQDNYSEVDASNPALLQTTSQMGGAAGSGPMGAGQSLLTDNPDAEELFDDVVFSAIEAQFSTRASALLANAETEQVVFFYPDGTATKATIRIQIGSTDSGDDTYVEVKVNGLTGMTRKSDLLLPDELTEAGQ